MILTAAQHLRKTPRRKIWLTCRRVAAVLGILALMSQAIFADSLHIGQVIQTLNPTQGTVDLRVSNQTPAPISPDVKGSDSSQSDKNKSSDSRSPDTPLPVSTSPLIGMEVSSQTPQIGVEVVGDAIVEGSVCDCGEIVVPGGFPKWPLLFLAAIPLIFIHDCDDCDGTPTPTPTPTPPPPPPPTPTPPTSTVPEPGTLLLLGTGLFALGAGLRRRYGKSRLAIRTQTEDE